MAFGAAPAPDAAANVRLKKKAATGPDPLFLEHYSDSEIDYALRAWQYGRKANPKSSNRAKVKFKLYLVLRECLKYFKAVRDPKTKLEFAISMCKDRLLSETQNTLSRMKIKKLANSFEQDGSFTNFVALHNQLPFLKYLEQKKETKQKQQTATLASLTSFEPILASRNASLAHPNGLPGTQADIADGSLAHPFVLGSDDDEYVPRSSVVGFNGDQAYGTPGTSLFGQPTFPLRMNQSLMSSRKLEDHSTVSAESDTRQLFQHVNTYSSRPTYLGLAVAAGSELAQPVMQTSTEVLDTSTVQQMSKQDTPFANKAVPQSRGSAQQVILGQYSKTWEELVDAPKDSVKIGTNPFAAPVMADSGKAPAKSIVPAQIKIVEVNPRSPSLNGPDVTVSGESSSYRSATTPNSTALQSSTSGMGTMNFAGEKSSGNVVGISVLQTPADFQPPHPPTGPRSHVDSIYRGSVMCQPSASLSALVQQSFESLLYNQSLLIGEVSGVTALVPPKVQGNLLEKMQMLLERSCFYWAKHNAPHMVHNFEWDHYRGVELTSWLDSLLKSSTTVFSEEALDSVKIPIHVIRTTLRELRNKAVHRDVQNDATTILSMIQCGRAFTELLGDRFCEEIFDKMIAQVVKATSDTVLPRSVKDRARQAYREIGLRLLGINIKEIESKTEALKRDILKQFGPDLGPVDWDLGYADVMKEDNYRKSFSTSLAKPTISLQVSQSRRPGGKGNDSDQINLFGIDTIRTGSKRKLESSEGDVEGYSGSKMRKSSRLESKKARDKEDTSSNTYTSTKEPFMVLGTQNPAVGDRNVPYSWNLLLCARESKPVVPVSTGGPQVNAGRQVQLDTTTKVDNRGGDKTACKSRRVEPVLFCPVQSVNKSLGSLIAATSLPVQQGLSIANDIEGKENAKLAASALEAICFKNVAGLSSTQDANERAVRETVADSVAEADRAMCTIQPQLIGSVAADVQHGTIPDLDTAALAIEAQHQVFPDLGVTVPVVGAYRRFFPGLGVAQDENITSARRAQSMLASGLGVVSNEAATAAETTPPYFAASGIDSHQHDWTDLARILARARSPASSGPSGPTSAGKKD